MNPQNVGDGRAGVVVVLYSNDIEGDELPGLDIGQHSVVGGLLSHCSGVMLIEGVDECSALLVGEYAGASEDVDVVHEGLLPFRFRQIVALELRSHG